MVKRSYSDDRLGERCYISQDVCARIGLETWGDPVEVLYPETGARTILPVWPLREWDPPDSIALDMHSRELLNVETDDEIKVHSPVFDLVKPSSNFFDSFITRLKTAILDFFIGRHRVSLRVSQGFNQDEHRNIGRVSQDLMDVMGIEPGELATIQWKNRTHKLQLLLPPDDEEIESLTIKLPSTERDQIAASIGDAVRTYRNMAYTFKKNMALSIFGVLGVLIGVFTIIDTLDIFGRYGPIVGDGYLFLIVVLTSVLVSIMTVWIMLYSERQAVTISESRR